VTERPDASQRGLAAAVRVLRIVTLAAGAALLVLFAWVVIARFLHPAADHEWMSGAVRDGVARVRDGQPLYAPPSASFIPFLYTPIYYWLAGAVAHVTSVFAASKVVSLAATAVCAAAVGRIAHKLGAGRFWTAVAVLLHLGAYGPTLWFYDLERVDATAAAMVTAAVAVVLEGEGVAITALGGALLGLSFFAKQAELLVFGGTAVGLLLSGQRRRAIVSAASGGAVMLVLGAILEARTGGWFSYYCLKLPRAHGISLELVPLFPLVDMPKAFALSAASLGFVVAAAARVVRGWRGREGREADAGAWRDVTFAAVLATSMLSALFHRAHVGGWVNVLLVWTPFACAAVGAGATRVARSLETEALVLAGVALQMLAWTFDPSEVAPTSADDRYAARMHAIVQKLEKDGEVVVTPTGDLTSVRHFHSAALFDVLRAGYPPPEDYVTKIRERKYAALVYGVPNDTPCGEKACAELHELVMKNYFVAARLEDPGKSGMIGFDARPRWVLRPRHAPASDLGVADLLKREQREVALAVERRTAAAPGDDASVPDDDIERRAEVGAR
jgi:hypothetical protein